MLLSCLWAVYEKTKLMDMTLVLTRSIDQSIRIGEDIVVKVVSIKGGVVKLGIDAPNAVFIEKSDEPRAFRKGNR